MQWLKRLTNRPSFFYVISHERSGTHFLINCIKLNTSVGLKYQSVGEWFGPFDQPEKRFDHIYAKFKSLNSKNQYLLKSHCDRALFEACYRPGKIIYIFRDYRDTLTSYYHFIKEGYPDWAQQYNAAIAPVWFSSFSEFIRQPVTDFIRLNYSLRGDFSTPIERWANHVIPWIQEPHPSIKIVTYNQLYFDAEKTTQDILDFLDLPCQDSFTHPNLQNAYSVAPRKGIVGDWKNQCSPDDLAFMEAAIADQRSVLDRFPWESTAGV